MAATSCRAGPANAAGGPRDAVPGTIMKRDPDDPNLRLDRGKAR